MSADDPERAIIFTDIIIELADQGDSFLEETLHLVLELKINGRVLTQANLSPLESSRGAWSTEEPIGFPVVDDIQCMIAVSKDIDGEQLAFLDLDGLELDAVTGNHYEIPLICHENIPSLILKTKTVIPARVEVRYPEGSIDQIREDARLGFEDFERHGRLEDLEKAISNYQKDVDMTPEDDPELHVALNNLAACLDARFRQLGRREDIDDSISQLRAAIELNNNEDLSNYRSLNNLGNSLKTRYEQYGNPLDLEDAIVQLRKAVDVVPDGHLDKLALLNSLGGAIGRRYERTGDRSDMNDGIACEQLAADLTPDAHPRKNMFLSNLGGSLQKRFLELGDLSDLDNGIAKQQFAISLTPDGHPQKPMYMSNLGNSLRIRFERLGTISDINSAISYQQLAVNLAPDGHIEKPMYRICLAASLTRRFERLDNLSDLNEAISQQQLAVSLTPDGHPSKAMYINNLGSALNGRFRRLGDIQDLDDAIEQGQLASKLAHERHPGKSMYLTNLGTAFATRFQQFGNISDINNAIMSNQKAVDLKSITDPDMPAYLSNLGVSYRIRFRALGHIMDAEAAIKHLSTAATSSVGSPNDRFKAATLWIMTASSIDHSSLLTAYESALELMPFVAWLGLPLADRHRQLVKIGGIAREAAAAAISLGQYDKALEWLEQGRSIVWTQLLQLRTPIDDLREVDPELAKRFLEVSQLLDRGTGEGDMLTGTTHDTEAEQQRYRGLTMEWESIIKKVRSLPGLERFLKPPSSSHLMKAAKNGPVVVLNVAEERCDALALVDGIDEVIHIPLPNITSTRVTELRDELMDQLYSDGIRQRGDMGGRAAKLVGESNSEQDCKHILGELWSCVVKPVLDSLAFSAYPDAHPRVWWCVTGPLAFLPIHAAGLYDQSSADEEIGNYVISSYTPTLSALLKPSQSVVDSSFKLLSVIQSSAPGASSIPSTKTELDHIRRYISEDAHVILEEDEATKRGVTREMEECNWLHLACHGIQMTENPTKSALLLQDGRLTLEEIIKLRLPKAEFAFLSACQTTAGDVRLSEESVHIAGGMQLAGYRSIVATMWSIRDDLAPEVADEFYRHIARNGRRPEATEAAEALHIAVQELRKKENVPLTAWIPYVHLGV